MTYQVSNHDKDKEFTGRHMLAIIVSFFGVIIAVNMTLAYFAVQSWSGLVVKNSYVASQKFNKTLEKAALQRARGWTSALSLEKNLLHFEIATKARRPVTGFEFTAHFQRPANERDDYKVKLSETAPGQYRASFNPQPGNWTISIQGRDGSDQQYRMDYEADMTSLLVKNSAKPGR